MADVSEAVYPGDEAFISLMMASQGDLRSFIFGLVPRQTDADDVVQEVNLALWRKRHLYDREQEYLRWAFGFAALEVKSFRSRSAKGRAWFSDTTVESLANEWPRAASFLDDCRRALEICLQKLGDVERQVINEKYGNRLNASQIGANLGKSEAAIYKILSRARESLRTCVKRAQMRASH